MNFSDYRASLWNSGHERVGDPGNYVTDLSFEEFSRIHNIPPFTNIDVLDIGVGYGRLARELHQMNNTVYCVDISDVALSRVKDIANVFLTQDIKDIPPVNLAISHLVFQHNSEAEIFRIINDVNLKDNGIFTFQIATLDPNRSILSPLIANDLNKGMLFFYSPEKIAEIIGYSNKSLISISDMMWHDAPFSFGWHIVKVANKAPNNYGLNFSVFKH